MVRREELQEIRATALTSATVKGTLVSANMRRYYYWIKVVNMASAGRNIVDIAHKITGKVTASAITHDRVKLAIVDETLELPSGGPKEDSLPILMIPASSYLTLGTNVGTALFYGLYADGP